MKISISGIRGIYGYDLNLHEIIRFSRLFASSLVRLKGKCVLARDTRHSGRIILQAASASLMEQGIDIFDLDVAPTPIVFRESRKYGAGLAITASHNPPEWNGLKFSIDGRGIYDDELELMLKGTIPSLGKIGNSQEIVSDYLDELLGLVTKTQGNIDVTVGIDQGGGAVCNYVEQLFKKLGVQFCCVNDSPGIFSRDPDPTVDELNDLRTLVLANNLDFGFAFDLDGDRLVVVNKNGIKLNPDSTLLMSIGGALDMGMKKFVTSIDTSVAVEKLIKSHHGRCDYSKVGESNVVKKMLEIHADAGGEGSSGGFILPGFNNCRDGMLAASTIACMNRSTINECLKLALEYSQIRLKIPVEPDSQMKLLDRLLDTLRSESSQILMIDGVKAIIDEDSWVLVRPSNTEDVIRLSLESKANNIQTLHKKILERIKFVVEHVR
ncbi:MAG TPA: hypothetical protein VJR67_01015 [Candidatus Nitrosopolaris sp.]|nr:hypothetical protein [Candidatus Nitrosopolaris sp.]